MGCIYRILSAVNPSMGDTEMAIVVEPFDVVDMCDAHYNMPVLA
jgi:hypothetical protein